MGSLSCFSVRRADPETRCRRAGQPRSPFSSRTFPSSRRAPQGGTRTLRARSDGLPRPQLASERTGWEQSAKPAPRDVDFARWHVRNTFAAWSRLRVASGATALAVRTTSRAFSRLPLVTAAPSLHPCHCPGALVAVVHAWASGSRAMAPLAGVPTRHQAASHNPLSSAHPIPAASRRALPFVLRALAPVSRTGPPGPQMRAFRRGPAGCAETASYLSAALWLSAGGGGVSCRASDAFDLPQCCR